MLLERQLVVVMLIVPALIGVEYQAIPYLPCPVSLVQHVDDHLKVRVVGYRITHYFAIVHVQYGRQIAFLPVDIYFGHVRSPFLVGRSRREVPVHYVFRDLAYFPLVGVVVAAFADILQIFFLHDPVHGLVVDSVTLVLHLGADSVVAVTALVFRMDSPYPPTFLGVAVGLFTEMVIVC